MAVLKVLASGLSAESMERAVIEYLSDVDELFGVLPFTKSETDEYSWYRTGQVPTATVVDPYGTIPTVDVKGTKMTTKISMFAADVDIYDFEAKAVEQLVDRFAEKSTAATEAIARAFKNLFINGDSANANEFDGLRKYITTDQTVDAGPNGSALSFDLLDQLIDKVKPRPDAIVMHTRTYLSFRALMRTLNTTPEMIQLPNFGKPVPIYEGIPILRNEYIPTNLTKGTGTNLTEVYAVRLGEMAVAGLYMGDNAGIRIEEVGPLETKNAYRYRIKWYASMKVHEPWQVAKIDAITN